MIPENQIPEHSENSSEKTPDNPTDIQPDTETKTDLPAAEKTSEISSRQEQPLEDSAVCDSEAGSSEVSLPKHQADMDTEKSVTIPEDKVLSEMDPEQAPAGADAEQKDEDSRSVEQLADEMEKIVNSDDAGAQHKTFSSLKDKATYKISEETAAKKQAHTEAGDTEENFSWKHPQHARIQALANIFKEKHDSFLKIQDEEQAKNLAERNEIIEKLKNLYTNTEPGTNLFKAIREIKAMWSSAGKIAKSEFKILNNNYFHHLNQFYALLDMNKEYLEQEYAHNLEKRQHIIERAKELENEPLVQKALNELQYLHKLWKEEAEPVAEEYREKTWEEFREISNRIHGRKAELSAEMESEQAANLETKNGIIAQIKAFATPPEGGTLSHSQWQTAIKKVEELRDAFLKTGSVPRKLSNQNWNEFKTVLREFNSKKNDFYKNLKDSQNTNLEKKKQLIQTAKDNMNSEDWDTAVPLFKKLQEEWKNIGHVPRTHANRAWEEFREACNTFFDNYRSKNNAENDNWKENYKNKKALLEQLKDISNEEGSVAGIEKIKAEWNAIGKVPKDKISINTEFNKVLRDKLKINKMSKFDLKDDNLSEAQATDKARKLKNQITDLESEIATLENNLGFFSNPSRENPLLKDTFAKIDDKKAQLDQLKKSLHNVIAGE